MLSADTLPHPFQHQCLRSVGDPDLLIYEKKLLAIVAKPSDIRNKYGDNISALSNS